VYQFLAIEQAGIIRTQSQSQHIRQAILQLLVDRFAGLLGRNDEAIGPAGQRDGAARLRPECDQAIGIGRALDRRHRGAHVGGDAVFQRRRLEDRGERLEREAG